MLFLGFVIGVNRKDVVAEVHIAQNVYLIGTQMADVREIEQVFISQFAWVAIK